MASGIGKIHCVTCGKGKAACICLGCSQHFCFQHFAEHRQVLERQFDVVENERNVFRQTFTEQKVDPSKHPLMRQIDQWERDSIRKIQQAANEAREVLIKHTAQHFNSIENKLSKLTEQLKQTREESDINEVVLKEFQAQLVQLKEELNTPTNIKIEQNSAAFVSKISVTISPNQSGKQIIGEN